MNWYLGVVTTYAGAAQTNGFVDGHVTSARFYGPRGVAIDTSNVIYISTDNGHGIRMISTTGMVTTLAGSPVGTSGPFDGFGTDSRLYYPCLIAVSTNGKIYIPDMNNNNIRVLDTTGNLGDLDAASASDFILIVCMLF
jgi:outer membrane protein assembly factor BamB